MPVRFRGRSRGPHPVQHLDRCLEVLLLDDVVALEDRRGRWPEKRYPRTLIRSWANEGSGRVDDEEVLREGCELFGGTSVELHEQVQRVQTRADLVEFVRALVGDHERHGDRWENGTLPRYLEALAGWIEDSDGYYRNQGRPVPAQPSWRDVADMLYAATLYE